MKRRAELDLDNYLNTWMQRKYGRLLDRFFQGTILTVTGSTGNFLVTLKRTGESVTDGNVYACVTPNYAPAVGDRVECIWRDQTTAYVLWKLLT